MAQKFLIVNQFVTFQTVPRQSTNQVKAKETENHSDLIAAAKTPQSHPDKTKAALARNPSLKPVL